MTFYSESCRWNLSGSPLQQLYQIKFAISGSHLDITTKLTYRAITTFLHLPNPEIIKMFLYTPCVIMCADTPLVIYLLNKTPLAVCKATLSITQPGSSISIHSYQCLQTQRLCIYLLDSKILKWYNKHGRIHLPTHQWFVQLFELDRVQTKWNKHLPSFYNSPRHKQNHNIGVRVITTAVTDTVSPMYYFKIQVSVCLLFIWSFDLARQFNYIQTYNLLNWRHKICTQVNKLSSWPCTPKCTCMYYIMILQTIFIFPRIKSLQEVY